MLSQKRVFVILGLFSWLGGVWAYSVAAPAYGVAAPIAAASKIDSGYLPALQKYGYRIGEPLLVRNYGPLTNLYSALAPKRSFVGTVDSGFYKDSYGRVKFRDETAIGAIVV